MAAPRERLLFVPIGLLAAAGLACGVAACGPSTAPSPFVNDAGDLGLDSGISEDAAPDASLDAAPDADADLGGPCDDATPCDDGNACTTDTCDLTLLRCRFTPDDSVCQNGAYCDGVERCDAKLGCRPGTPVACSDDDTCSLDSCVEATQSCAHAPRDADGDGDPDVHCPPAGHDCDDADPSVSSLAPELCGNGKDDNCNGSIDEVGCVAAAHDTCLDPLVIAAPGSYALSTVGCKLDYGSPCALAGPPPPVDAVAAIVVPKGPPVDVSITARSQQVSGISATLATECGNPNSVLTCGGPFPSLQGGQIAKLRARAVGDAAMDVALPLFVATTPAAPITLEVAFFPPEPPPTNETCGAAIPIQPKIPVIADLVGTTKDLASVCASGTGELVYSFTLGAPANVDVFATSIDGDGTPTLSLRGSGCALPADEITCENGPLGHIFRQSLPAGIYYVATSASAPTTLSVTLELSAASPLADDETCAGAPLIAANHTKLVDLSTHQDDISLGCLPGAVDAAYTLDLAAKSDVLLVQQIAAGDVGAIELALPACGGPADLLACSAGAPYPLRAAKHGVAAGSYRVVAESLSAQASNVTAFVRDAVAPTLVPFADACADVVDLPKSGGFFQGTTANASANFNAGCDLGGVPQGGAPDQLLRLVLDAKQRVVLDMSGSGYTTLLDVRKGPMCPGVEVPLGCTVGYGVGRSFLDLTLEAGTYYLQIDGFALDAGPWFLDVRVVDP